MVVKQQINLFQSGLLKKRDPLSAKRALAVVVAGICLLLALFGYGRWQVRRLSRQLQATQTRMSQTGQRLAQLQTHLAPKGKSPLLEQEIQRLKTAKGVKQNLLDRFGSKVAGDTTGFSGFLRALARRHVPGLWLREIILGGGEVTLEGSARSPEQVPRYLQQLAKEGVFRGLEFNQFSLGRSEAGYLDFLLNTAPEEKK